MSRLRARIQRLERAAPKKAAQIDWDSFWRWPEDVVPDGVVDWEAMFARRKPWSPEDCLIERAILAAGENRAGEAEAVTPPSHQPGEGTSHDGGP